MKNVLTFIIPVRHQDNARDWRIIKRNLSDTMKSIANQDCPYWNAVVIANHDADLPDIPHGFSVKRVDYPPNQLFQRGNLPEELFYEAVRSDKGRRVLAGMLHAGEMGHVMIVDDDDFVSRRLTSFVSARPADNGWFVRDGYIWSSGGRFLYLYGSDFSRLCGTSHIIRADLYELPDRIETVDEVYVRRTFGSHIYVREHLHDMNKPLQRLPFPGAIYRTGHQENHSGATGILSSQFLGRRLLWRPIELAKRIARIRIKSRSMDKEFFGGNADV